MKYGSALCLLLMLMREGGELVSMCAWLARHAVERDKHDECLCDGLAYRAIEHDNIPALWHLNLRLQA
eukprot:1137566-Pelagomonas_calceolata.AAC.2